jgi:prophage tail gpP-like protein
MRRAYVTLDDRDVAWKAITVSRSLDAFVGSASVVLALAGALPDVGARLRVGVSGDSVETTILNGYVDAIGASGSSLGGEVVVDGRERASAPTGAGIRP